MKNRFLVVTISLVSLGMAVPAYALPEILDAKGSVAVSETVVRADAHDHHNNQIVLNGMTRHELDVHSGGG